MPAEARVDDEVPDERRRRAAVARADSLRDDPARRAEVLAAYLAHRAHLEPDTAAGAQRVGFVLEHVSRATQGLEDLFAAAGAAAPDSDVADRALVAAASFATARGDHATTFERLREVLLRRRGSQSGIERAACINLARTLRLDGRLAESLLAARRAATMTVDDDDPRGRVAALGALAAALVDLGETARAEAVTRDLGALLPDAPGDAGTAAVQGILARLRIDMAHRARRFDEAVWRIDVLAIRERIVETRRRASLMMHRAHVLTDAERYGQAAHALREASRVPTRDPRDELRLRVLQARVAAALQELDAARERATQALALADRLVARPGPHRFWAGELVDVFRQLNDTDAERRCLEILATERLEQIAQVDRSAQHLPELTGRIHEEDREILRRARERALDAGRDALAAFARLLAPAIRDGDARALVLLPVDGDHVRVCAWCTRVAGRDGRWLPLGHLIPATGPIRATHGMCPDCLSDAPVRAVAQPTP